MTNPCFELHPQLAADCFELGHFPLSRLLLMNEARYPWLILVPERASITEIHALEPSDQLQLIVESSALSRHMKHQLGADKMNLAAIGNRVPQLHLHHVARYRGDAAWPAPVWGRFSPEPYRDDQRALLLKRLDLHQLPDFVPAQGG